jgi:hypothetical protein
MNSDVVRCAHPLSLHPLIVVWGGTILGSIPGVPIELMDFFSFLFRQSRAIDPSMNQGINLDVVRDAHPSSCVGKKSNGTERLRACSMPLQGQKSFDHLAAQRSGF